MKFELCTYSYELSAHTGPLAGYLITRFGGRKISIIGTLMCGMGLVIASQATQAYQFCLTFGILAGNGKKLLF